jgi:hypothetical protein
VCAQGLNDLLTFCPKQIRFRRYSSGESCFSATARQAWPSGSALAKLLRPQVRAIFAKYLPESPSFLGYLTITRDNSAHSEGLSKGQQLGRVLITGEHSADLFQISPRRISAANCGLRRPHIRNGNARLKLTASVQKPLDIRKRQRFSMGCSSAQLR